MTRRIPPASRPAAAALAAAACLLAACQAPETGPSGTSAARIVPRAEADSLRRISSAFDLDSAVVAGDSLVAWVRYGGGCREHAFTFLAADYMLMSEPPQMEGWIHHEVEGGMDPCKAYQGGLIAFHLTPLLQGQDATVLRLWPHASAGTDPLVLDLFP